MGFNWRRRYDRLFGRTEKTTITAIDGWYKDDHFEMKLGSTPDKCEILMNGIPLKYVQEAAITASVNQPTKMVITTIGGLE